MRYPLFEIILLTLLLGLLLFVFLTFRKSKRISLFNATLTVEELEKLAKRTAIAHTIAPKKRLSKWPLIRVKENYGFIKSVYNDLNEDIRHKRAVPPAAEWILDNFYIIEEQTKSIRRDLRKKDYFKLPTLNKGPFSGETRVLAIALEFIGVMDGQIDDTTLLRYLDAYQSHNVLFDREIRMIPMMLQIALLEKVRAICDNIKETQQQWELADNIINKYWLEEGTEVNRIISAFKNTVTDKIDGKASFIEHLFFRFRRSGRSYVNVLKAINDYLVQFSSTTEIIAQKEHNSQAVSSVSMGNAIMSFKYISSLNWTDLFEAVSFVEKILRKDPEGVYSQMTSQTKGHYLMKIEKIAKAYGVSERHIAQVAIDLACRVATHRDRLDQVTNDYLRRSHVGYYLIGDGLSELEKTQNRVQNLGEKVTQRVVRYQGLLYTSLIVVLATIILGITVKLGIASLTSSQLLMGLIIGLICIIPSTELSVTFANWLVGKIKKPSFFPSLELKEGIPDALRTMVVVPALLSDESRVKAILKNLENHYLANREKNLYFALIGGYKDSEQEQSPDERQILECAQKGINSLNQKYEGDFFRFYHRNNTFNKSEGRWTGWERKRGALMEFNELLYGDKSTSFIEDDQNTIKGDQIKYIITLDADTQLPLGMAKKMIGTMAHPHHLPVIDHGRNVVVEGHGLMQPRVLFDMDSSNKTYFSRVYTGQVGLDPYANAVSDVYQDLFDEGIFTGKGIYDLNVFRTVMRDVVPENSVLSHDLLEGSYLRAALVSNLELVDSYPTKFNAYMARLYRWIRGDWQLLPWLSATVQNKNDERIKNPLSFISLWKMADNLRRSLIAPSILTLVVLGLIVLPENATFWIIYAAIIMIWPIALNLIDWFVSSNHKMRFKVLESTLMQLVLSVIFLSYQSMMNLHAILLTLSRVLFTKKNMLEWVTSDDAERLQSSTIKSYISLMGLSALIGLPLVGMTFILKPENLLLSILFAMIWGSAPFIAYLISKHDDEKEVLNETQLMDLHIIARKTYRYFEEFANKKNNYLAPDNYQAEPYRGIAYRTSPTNIGIGLLSTLSARDLGYIGFEVTLSTIENTMNTLRKLEKWHGHLYNWYDTRTLESLKPNYVSTVDSGNLVCYLMTLRQGLIEYRQRGLVDPVSIKGIETTYACDEKRESSFFSELDSKRLFTLNHELSLTGYRETLEIALERMKGDGRSNAIWQLKTQNLVDDLLLEVDHFYPWIKHINQMPTSRLDDITMQSIDDLVKSLTRTSSLTTYRTYCEESQELCNHILIHIKSLNHTASSEWIEWINVILILLEKGVRYVTDLNERYENMIETIYQFTEATHFEPLYEKKRQLFSIGFNLEHNRLSNSYYDLLASEARQTSFIAIARGEVEPKHWEMLGRSLTKVGRHKGLVSWSGTMFEYLMPLIVMKNYKNTLLDETYTFVVESQKKYGKERNMPWGASESGFGAMDIRLDYQYKAIGVPWLGLKRGLIEDAVATPYATFLALPVAPRDAYKNVLHLRREGLEGDYGYYEAVDYTAERLTPGLDKMLVKSYMAHHQGMSFLSLNNYLNQNILQFRFSADPYVNAAKLLLQEKVPTNVVFTKESKEKVLPFKGTVHHDQTVHRTFTSPNKDIPKAHVLSNGYYSIVTTDKGTGYSRTKDYAITRWREDSTMDHYGMFFYLKNRDTNDNWCSAYSPYNILPKGYEVSFTADKTMVKRVDGNIETRIEIIVASGDNAEIRRIELKNNDSKACEIEITSYYEIVLANQKSDEAHPAFSNLFVETEFNQEFNALIAHRRKRSEKDMDLWMAHMAITNGNLVGDIQYETDRMAFIGRGRTLSNPTAISRERPLSNTVGNVLDPIFSLRINIRLMPEHSNRVSFVTITGNSREQIFELITKYNSVENCDAAFWLAVIRSQIETKYLNMSAHEMERYQEMISDILFISPLRRNHEALIRKNIKGQSDLWSHGISGDRPIVLVKVSHLNDVEILYDLLKAHEYWRLKDMRVDLVILVMEEFSYINPVFSLVTDIVESSQSVNNNQIKGDLFILNYSVISKEDMYLLTAISRLCFDGQNGSVSDQLRYTKEALNENDALNENGAFSESEIFNNNEPNIDVPSINPNQFQHNNEQLEFFNGIGGFNNAHQTYEICLNPDQTTPVPWSNIISNQTFGFITTESGGGFTWYMNSRENKLTSWSNDAVCDVPSEIFYLKDETGALWTLAPSPIRGNSTYVIEHGYGFTTFEHQRPDVHQKLTQFVPVNGNIKISLIELKNEGPSEKLMTITYYLEPVLGVSRSDTAMHIISDITETGTLTLKNNYNRVYSDQIMFIESSSRERSFSGDRRAFFGMGNKEKPDALKNKKLSNCVGAGYDPGAVMQIELSIPAYESIKCVFVMGIAENEAVLTENATKYNTVASATTALEEVKAFWQEKLNVLLIETPDMAMNQLLNGRLLYQVIACRLWARSGFYQSGGAFGFRDQLQDSLSLLPIWPELTKAQILKHAAHQFPEGDVLHWWHEPELKGTRTRISDDYLWLPYVVAEYITTTEDYAILMKNIPYITGETLNDFEDEAYISPQQSAESGTVFEHCIKAIEYGLKFGVHGLPLMGSGDWNDGMNRVGIEGKGESIWLAWFLSDILKKWIPLCKMHDQEERALKYYEINKNLVTSVEENGWDGNWYKRAYFDDGTELGSSKNSECKIDSLAQTWAVLSDSGNNERAKMAMTVMEDYLVSHDEGIIKLLSPPFDNGVLEPGYIKGYVPGVRENGGQYTHAATWVVAAFAKLGDGDKAFELFEMINPINHARTKIELGIYKTEPYVMAADVYGCRPHTGRGGWTWYTGAAGWMYQAGLIGILGFHKLGNSLVLDPCIPRRWPQYSIHYQFENTLYEIKVFNPNAISYGHISLRINGIEVEGKSIPLIGGMEPQSVEVIIN